MDAANVAGATTRISEDGRRLLREAAVAAGVDVAVGNKIADWLDKHPSAVVTIEGRTPEPPLRVYGKPDEDPMPSEEEE